MQTIKITKRFTNDVIWEGEAESLMDAVLKAKAAQADLSGADLSGADLSRADLSGANLSGANLSRADLSGANLSRANLRGADLRGADLSGADLSGADLRGADLSGADLRGADLSGANLSGANLSRADLSGANLSRANLRGADLRGADLSGADLRGADLSGADLSRANLSGANLLAIKADFFEILLRSTREIPGLVEALQSGGVDGSTYHGDCCCLVGTVASVRGCDYTELRGITPDQNRPAERWFLGIRTGDIPETNPISALTLEWIEEFQELLAAASHVSASTPSA